MTVQSNFSAYPCLSKCALAVASVLLTLPALSSAQENTSLQFGADVELDFDAYRDSGAENSDDDTQFDNGGRVRVTATGKHTMGDYFIEGRGDALLKVDGNAVVDDAWFAFGSSMWSAKFGRFEAINLFPLGKDTIIRHAGGVPVYEANLARGRVSDAGQIALMVHPSQNLSLELDTIYGDPGDGTKAFGGIRPSVTMGMGNLTFTLGGELIKYDLDDGTEVDVNGIAATANINAGGANINANIAYAEDDNSNADTTTFGLNMIYGNAGLGVIHSEADVGGDNDPSVTTVYGAYTVPIFTFDRATATFAASYSTADDVGENVDDESVAFRVRFNYTF